MVENYVAMTSMCVVPSQEGSRDAIVCKHLSASYSPFSVCVKGKCQKEKESTLLTGAVPTTLCKLQNLDNDNPSEHVYCVYIW